MVIPGGILSHAVLVGLGGFLGSVCRFFVQGAAHRITPFMGFPVGTLVVNVIGCFLIGLLNGLADTRQLFGPEARLFLFIGVFGGFTTYSTFGFETVALLRDAEVTRAVTSVFMHLVAGLGAVWFGDFLSRLS